MENVGMNSAAMPEPSLVCVTLLVRDYDEAKEWYCNKLGFRLTQDIPLSKTKRWVTIAANRPGSTALLLARADGTEQESAIGKQAGGRVFLFLQTDDFEESFKAMTDRGVRFCEDPRREDYGVVAVFVDLYGNRWDLIQPSRRELSQ